MPIRDETAGDISAISRLVTEALLLLAQSTGTEAGIVEALRADGALALSLVAEEDGEVVGYLAASAARIGTQVGWGLIGPLVVLPSRHRQGIGTALMAEALGRLRRTSRGAALVGDPAYYGRFGFRAYPGLGITGCPPRGGSGIALRRQRAARGADPSPGIRPRPAGVTESREFDLRRSRPSASPPPRARPGRRSRSCG